MFAIFAKSRLIKTWIEITTSREKRRGDLVISVTL